MVQFAAALLLVALLAAQQPQTPPLPTFRSSVEVTTVDVTVVDNAGRPLADLQPADFTVRIDGRVRRVISAQ